MTYKGQSSSRVNWLGPIRLVNGYNIGHAHLEICIGPWNFHKDRREILFGFDWQYCFYFTFPPLFFCMGSTFPVLLWDYNNHFVISTLLIPKHTPGKFPFTFDICSYSWLCIHIWSLELEASNEVEHAIFAFVYVTSFHMIFSTSIHSVLKFMTCFSLQLCSIPV